MSEQGSLVRQSFVEVSAKSIHCFFSSCAIRGSWSRTLDLGMTRWMFYNCATTTGFYLLTTCHPNMRVIVYVVPTALTLKNCWLFSSNKNLHLQSKYKIRNAKYQLYLKEIKIWSKLFIFSLAQAIDHLLRSAPKEDKLVAIIDIRDKAKQITP